MGVVKPHNLCRQKVVTDIDIKANPVMLCSKIKVEEVITKEQK